MATATQRRLRWHRGAAGCWYAVYVGTLTHEAFEPMRYEKRSLADGIAHAADGIAHAAMTPNTFGPPPRHMDEF